MAVYKCKMCGGTIEVTEGQKVVTCEYCGATQTVHSFDNEKKTTFFKRAEALRFKCEFDKAAGVYETIVSEFPHEAEAYWGLVLCKYGIEYVDDPKTGKKIPTCHRTQFASIYEDADYMNVLKYADVVAKTVYEQEAKEISKLQKSILDISSKEDPFDIFICYKENDNHGERTKDSVLAQNIYKELHREGYRIFFARITLEDKLGTQYEPYIFAALHSAKVMLHVTMSAEHSESVWVRNEWSRFLSLIAEGQQKVLIPCYKDMSAYDLPDEMQSLQGQDMSKVGAMQDLVYGIEKIFRKKTGNIEKTETGDKTTGSSSYKGLIKKGFTYLKNGRFEEADSTFDAAIKISEMPGEAYLGKVLAEYQFKTVDEVLESADEIVADCDNFVMAKEFADEETAKLLKKIEDTLRYNRLKENYESAMNQYNEGDSDSLSLAKDNFIALEDFENSREMVKECTYKLGVVYMSYITGIKTLGYCNDAIECFEEVIDYKDSKEKIDEIGAIKEKIISEYKELCISKLSILYPKTIDYSSFADVAKRIKDNRSIVFTPNYEEFDSTKKVIEDEAIKFFVSKSPAYIQTLNQLSECERFNRLCLSIETNNNLKSTHELIFTREQELKAVLKKKKKKRVGIIAAIAGTVAVVIAVTISVLVSINNKNTRIANTYASAVANMENGNYDDAIASFSSVSDYKDSESKIKVCNGLKQLELSIQTKKEEDAVEGIKTIVSAGEKVDVTYETENNVNIKRLAGGNSGNKTETIETVDFTFYSPSWTGYTFLNWNSNTLSYKDNRTYLGLMSNWSLNTYSISFDLNSGYFDDSTVVPATYSVESSDITLPLPKKTGYSFDGWLMNGEYVAKIAHGSTGDVSFVANWTPNQYTITLNPNGGTVHPATITATYDANYSLPTPSRDNYGFTGWYDSSNNKWTDGVYKIVGNTSLTAHWNPNTYTITYNPNGGTISGSSTQDVVYGEPYTLRTVTRDGYTFLGWYDGTEKVESGVWNRGSNLSLTAKWEAKSYKLTLSEISTACHYYLTLHKNNGTSDTKIEVSRNTPISYPTAPTKSKCVFKGWYSDSSCTTLFDFSQNINKNTDIYAGWRTISSSTVVVDDLSGNTYQMSSTYDDNIGFYVGAYHNTTYTLHYTFYSTGARTAYIFFYDIDDGQSSHSAVLHASASGSYSMAVTAGHVYRIGISPDTWYSDKKISCYLTGSYPTPTTVVGDNPNLEFTFEYDKNYSLGIPDSRAGKTFVGWYTGENGTGTKLTGSNGNSLSVWKFTTNITAYPYFE